MLLRNLQTQLRQAVTGDSLWEPTLADVLEPQSARAVHLAILVEPFLGQLLAGSKTIESRFARDRRAPYAQVGPGDLLLLKRSGGPVCGLALVRRSFSALLTADVLQTIRARYGASLCAEDDTFWAARLNARYVTLIWLDQVRSITPIALPRRDRRGWVVLQDGASSIASQPVPAAQACGSSAARDADSPPTEQI